MVTTSKSMHREVQIKQVHIDGLWEAITLLLNSCNEVSRFEFSGKLCTKCI